MTFVKESDKEYITMTDEQEVHCYYSNKKNSFENATIFFMQGFGSGVYSWTDCWDELHKEFNLIVMDPRDKATVKLKKKSKCTVQRIALDIVETLHHFRVNEKDVIFIASSLGASIVAHCISQGWVKPRGCFFAGPSIKPRNPKFLLYSTFLFPNFIVDKLGKFVGRKYLQNKVAEGFQRKVFYNRIENIDVARWKHCIRMSNWNAAEDFKQMNCIVYIIRTTGDKYHELESTEEVKKLITNSQIIDVPSYDFIHVNPGVKEFVSILKRYISDISSC